MNILTSTQNLHYTMTTNDRLSIMVHLKKMYTVGLTELCFRSLMSIFAYFQFSHQMHETNMDPG